MQSNIITWNATNMITVCLMALLGFALLSVASQMFHSSRSKTTN